MSDDSNRRPATQLVTLGRDAGVGFDYVNPPLVRGSTVLHADVADMRSRVARRNAGEDGEGGTPAAYGIYGTPSHLAFYKALTALEGGHRSWAFPSGLTACTMAILAFVQQGDHVLVPDSVYGPTRRFAATRLPRYGVQASFYDRASASRAAPRWKRCSGRNTRLLFLESPGSLTFEMQDVPLLAQVARGRDAVSVIDNTWATPLYSGRWRTGSTCRCTRRPSTSAPLGSDHRHGHLQRARWRACARRSTTTGLTNQPGRLLAGAARPALDGRAAGAAPRTAEALIAWLKRQPEVERILYPADPGDPGHALCSAT